MDLFTVLGACLRRWYVTVPIVAGAGYLALVAYEAVPPQYTSSVSIVVLPSNTPVPLEEDLLVPLPDNPYSGSGGPRFAAAVLARNINTQAYRELIGLEGVPDVSFEAGASKDQPIIAIDAYAPTPEAVLATLEAVSSQAEIVLREFQTQAGAPEERLYRIAPAVPADRVEDVTPSRFRTAGALLVIGFVVAGAVGTGVDVLIRRWRARRAEVAAAAPTDSEVDEAAAVEATAGTSAADVPIPTSSRRQASNLTGKPVPSRSDPVRADEAAETVRGL